MNEDWKGKGYSFFSNKACEYFPCHETKNPDDFNCLFCYCPLYALGERCGGNFSYYKNGVKDCSGCMVPHKRDNYGHVLSKFEDIVALTKKQTTE